MNVMDTRSTSAMLYLDGVHVSFDGFHAINDFCPHMGASLAGGHVEDGAVYCPWHAWRFCVRDGLWLDNPKSQIRTDTFEVRVVDGNIQVRVPEPDEQE